MTSGLISVTIDDCPYLLMQEGYGVWQASTDGRQVAVLVHQRDKEWIALVTVPGPPGADRPGSERREVEAPADDPAAALRVLLAAP